MARPLRIEFPGALYHITSRGNARQRVFRDDEDRETFLATLAWVVERFGWRCHAYCLMENHVHLLIQTPQPNLSRGMRQLNGVYTHRFNRRHNKVGHLFQGRFKAILVEQEPYLLELARYIVLNPVRAKMVKSPERYAWSSYRPMVGLAPVPPALETEWVLAQFGSTKATARKRYAEFVQDGVGVPGPWDEVKGQVLLGSEAFIERLAQQLQECASAEIPKRQRLVHRPSLKTLLAGADSKTKRNAVMAQAYLKHGYTLTEIGRAIGLHYATVSRIIAAMEKTS
ncbi:REP-associated tyrosine transposase [Nitrospira sp. NS4]|uniref:REP-associated tyrosine transposase n=1 Tax=Nitrospira sp. NS4 TaxID=3414498 RepID=UPI003C2C74A2